MEIEDNKKRDADGRVIVEMMVSDDTSFLSPFAKKDAPVISSDVATFLENSLQTVAPKEQLCLHVYSDCIDDDEKVVYNGAIHRYYSDSLSSVTREYKRNWIIALVLFLLGMATIAVSIIVGRFGREIWMEAIDIVAWVFCWEAVDMAFFKTRSLSINKKRYSAMSKMTIQFFPLTERKVIQENKAI